MLSNFQKRSYILKTDDLYQILFINFSIGKNFKQVLEMGKEGKKEISSPKKKKRQPQEHNCSKPFFGNVSSIIYFGHKQHSM